MLAQTISKSSLYGSKICSHLEQKQEYHLCIVNGWDGLYYHNQCPWNNNPSAAISNREGEHLDVIHAQLQIRDLESH